VAPWRSAMLARGARRTKGAADGHHGL